MRYPPVPVTTEEIVACLLRQAKDVAAEGRRGDPRPMLLREAAKIVTAASKGTLPERDER